ncbi:helix-turn-helix transcriptional regulator [Paenibacillus sp. GCM10027626]|uniref:helix-turn-helix transcriptional regulator n=1 Tax=Paenibacillus sp. GCM10027626 TaxID=3273411 RepID=UPI003632E46D
MVYLLLEKKNMTAPELATHFEVSVRTIYRDIDMLSAAGIPVYTTQGKGGGISIRDNFVLNKSLISEQEQQQILMALQGINIVGGGNTSALLAKLGGIFQKQNVNWIEVDFSEWHRTNENVFQTLKNAIFQNKKVSFKYFSGKGEATDRFVEPLKLVFKSKDWFLYAYCGMRKDYRFFKLMRIKELAITVQSFTRTAPAQIFEHFDTVKEEAVSLTLLFDKVMAFRVYDHFDDVIEREDGDFLVKLSLPYNEWLFNYLLSFGDKVEVLAPQIIREEIKVRINNMKNKYKT